MTDTLQIKTAQVFEPLLHPARYRAIHGGRAKGASHFFAELAIERCLQARTDIVCVREVQRSLKQSVKKLLEDKIKTLGVGAAFNVMDDQIKAPYGGQIIFQGMQNHTAQTIKSLEGYDVAYIEEGQTLSQTSLDILRPTIIRKPGSEVWAAWNPRFATDPIDAFFRTKGERPPGSIVIEASYRDNPWISQESLDEAAYDLRRDKDKYAHVWMGGYETHSEARVFRNWEVREFDVDRTATIRQGADWGFSVDPSVLVQCYIVGRTLFVPYEAYRVGCEINDTPDLFMSVPDAEKWPIVADSARPETVSYMQQHGFPKMTAAIKGAKSVEEGVEFLKSYDIVVHPRCIHTVDELTSYRYKTDKLTGEVLPELEDAKNNVIDALRYACENARRAMASKPLPPKQRFEQHNVGFVG